MYHIKGHCRCLCLSLKPSLLFAVNKLIWWITYFFPINIVNKQSGSLTNMFTDKYTLQTHVGLWITWVITLSNQSSQFSFYVMWSASRITKKYFCSPPDGLVWPQKLPLLLLRTHFVFPTWRVLVLFKLVSCLQVQKYFP